VSKALIKEYPKNTQKLEKEIEHWERLLDADTTEDIWRKVQAKVKAMMETEEELAMSQLDHSESATVDMRMVGRGSEKPQPSMTEVDQATTIDATGVEESSQNEIYNIELSMVADSGDLAENTSLHPVSNSGKHNR
jgi:hypothetical protein